MATFFWKIARLDESFIFVNSLVQVEFVTCICATFKAKTGWLVTDSCHGAGVNRSHGRASQRC